MDVVILCGGMGSRLSEETIIKPKPMVEIGGRPILWHIMKYYSSFGYKRFVLALGYKANYIKEYFYNHRISASDFTMKMNPGEEPQFLNFSDEQDWEITFVDTGLNTLKGGRIKRIQEYIKSDKFHITYGDGVCDVDIDSLVRYHDSHDGIGTVTAVHPPSRFGEMSIVNGKVEKFDEKPQMDEGYINGGFFIWNKKVFDYLSDDESCDFEFGPMQKLVSENQVFAYKHDNFWQCMDNIREKHYLDKLISQGKAPWIKW